MPVTIFAGRTKPNFPLRKLQRCLDALLKQARVSQADVELTLVGEQTIRNLNRRFRAKDRVTDVLSFPQQRRPEHHGAPWLLGEIVVALPVARRQAARAGRTLIQQVLRLGVHGVVHLLGHDHELGPAEQKKFESLERRYLSALDREGWLPWDGSLRL